MRTTKVDRLFTVGYQGRDVDAVVQLLRSAHVTTLVDVRAIPLSRKPAFRKNALAEYLRTAGIAYHGVTALGTPGTLRDRLRDDGNYATFFRDFRRHLIRVREPLEAVASLIPSHRIALLCFERDPATCHRSVVADFLERMTATVTLHLGA